MASWIIDRIPEHHTYLEPFFGSGGVFFSKQPSNIETINDRDEDVSNLFEVIRDDPEQLAWLVSMTPYGRVEYLKAFENVSDPDRHQRARAFLVRCWQGHGFRTNEYRVGWKNDIAGREQMYAAYDWYRLPKRILDTADRLKQVQIENQPAIKLIQRYNYDKVFIYVDPPYVIGSRSGQQKQYKHEMTDDDHIKLLKTLVISKAKVMISGYENDIYNEHLKGWNKDDLQQQAEYGGDRHEIIWYNYDHNEQIELEI